MGETVTFKRPDGRECSGYYIQPSSGDGGPGVVVIQEWWGLNNHIKSIADRIAAAGYRALAPDLYRGKLALEAAEAAHLMGELDFEDAAAQDVRGAIQYLKKHSTAVATVGFCLGGALAILTAIHVPEADAVVSWYGLPPEDAGDPRAIRIPLQGHFALDDYYFTPPQVDALEAKLKEGGVSHEFFRYQANHAFGNEEGPHYDPEAATLAWKRSFEFLSRHCK
jgi:carboxymethylenebutenolidase